MVTPRAFEREWVLEYLNRVIKYRSRTRYVGKHYLYGDILGPIYTGGVARVYPTRTRIPVETCTPPGIFQFKIFSTSLQTARVICLLVVFDLSCSYFRCSCKYRVTAPSEWRRECIICVYSRTNAMNDYRE